MQDSHNNGGEVVGIMAQLKLRQQTWRLLNELVLHYLFPLNSL